MSCWERSFEDCARSRSCRDFSRAVSLLFPMDPACHTWGALTTGIAECGVKCRPVQLRITPSCSPRSLHLCLRRSEREATGRRLSRWRPRPTQLVVAANLLRRRQRRAGVLPPREQPLCTFRSPSAACPYSNPPISGPVSLSWSDFKRLPPAL